MLLGEIISVALGALRANKLRSLLTMLGIVIGVGAVIAVVALGTGAQQAVKDRIAALGTTLLTVNPGQQRGQGVAIAGGQQRLTIDDANAVDERATTLLAVQPEMRSQQQVVYGNKNANTQIIGTTPNYLEVRKYTLKVGKMFTAADNEGRQRVVVLGSAVVDNLGITTPEALIGELVRIRGTQFQVIGVLASKGQANAFQNPDDQVLVPIQTARFRVNGSDRLQSISALAETEDKIPDAMADIQRILRRQHRIRQGAPDDFQIRNQSDILTTTQETTQVMTYLLSGIAAVSLLVGGIGIMNIMLVSVTERTREIGIRKALGATRWNILLQFLIEAVVLCILGGILGIALGAGGAVIMSQVAGWTTRISSTAIVMAFAFSAFVGVAFGVWPARRAAVLDPIIALRYE
ncbi:MAG TPA: ABC transporter permease [Xanthobacteraceae bacterium]|jgi:putative ABC transport system permease protein|nr:ABC transporter permease [Gemmatimonadaceae bacterium]HWP15548.1 ABC transporter permease [Xanthobacteraceae bacterium]HZJ30014.1 ABC transporter permease [Vicinamibacterales bacterium]